MQIIKTIYFLADYTLQFGMWLVIGRLASQVIIGRPDNFAVQFFVRFTEPLYHLCRQTFPFLRVPEEKKGTGWDYLGGWVPFFIIAVIFFLLRPLLRIVVSVILVNFGPPAP
jgi:hypothetical protein